MEPLPWPVPQPKLLDRVRDAIPARHDGRRTEVADVTWIRRYIGFHSKAHPSTLGAPAITAFLTWLATTRQVSASTQNLWATRLLRSTNGGFARARTPARRQQCEVLAGARCLGVESWFNARELNDIRRLILEQEQAIIGARQELAVSVESRISSVEVTDEVITARLVDGRVISVPLAWAWRLSDATPAQRKNWQLIGDGHGVHWPDVMEPA
jgi:hypothetical protein